MSTDAHYDLVIAAGRVIDPSQDIDAVLDVAFVDGRVAALGCELGPARQRIDAVGQVLTPGLIDIHSHFFHGTGFPQMDPRRDLVPTGVTSAADAGSSGAANFTLFREFLIDPAPLHLYAWLNIEALGLTAQAYPRAPALDVAVIDDAVGVIDAHRDVIVGVKVLAPSAGREAGDGPELVRRAVEAAERTGTRVLCHVDGGTDLLAVLELLRAGDVLSHCYHGNEPHLLDPGHRVRSEVRSARRRGVLFDVCPCGGYHFAWSTAHAATAQGFFPDLIGTDFVHLPEPSPSYAITDCMSIMLGLGMPLVDVIAAVTANAAVVLGQQQQRGSLEVGRDGDATLLAINDEPVTYSSQHDGDHQFDRRIRPVGTVISGALT